MNHSLSYLLALYKARSKSRNFGSYNGINAGMISQKAVDRVRSSRQLHNGKAGRHDDGGGQIEFDQEFKRTMHAISYQISGAIG
jgi:hypothetical protein